jgi:hypothetical protein
MIDNVVYVIVDCCSGEDYSTDDPTVLLITTDKDEAQQFFNDEISNWEDGMTNFDSNITEHYGETKLVYECTDYEGDSHRVMKLVEKEIQ